MLNMEKKKNKFSSMVLDNVRKGGIPCMDTSPGSARAHINQSKSTLVEEKVLYRRFFLRIQ